MTIVTLAQPSDTAIQFYQDQRGFNLRLYNGSEYIRTYPGIAGHPFLKSDSLQRGWIAYDDVLYQNISLNFDIVRDEVVVQGAQTFYIALVPQKIDSFGIAGRTFIRTPKGIYEVLQHGRMMVLAKTIKQSTQAGRPEDPLQFAAKTTYHLVQGERWTTVSNRKDLLNAFGEQKDAVRKWLQQQNINYKQAPAQALIAAAQYYNQTTN